MGFALRSTRSGGGLVAVASGDTASPIRREFICGKGAPDAGTAHRRHRTRLSRRVRCRSCRAQVVRAPENQQSHPVSVCDAEDLRRRCSGRRTTRRLDRHSRVAQLARRCRSPKECRLGSIKRVGLQFDHLRCSARRAVDERRRGGSERRRGGPGQRSDYGGSGAAADASAAAAAL